MSARVLCYGMVMTKEEFLKALKLLLAASVIEKEKLLDSISKRIDEIKCNDMQKTNYSRRKRVKEYLNNIGVPKEYQFKVCKMFMVDRMQYPPKLPTGWNGVCKKVLSRWDEFQDYCKEIDYEIIDKTIP